MNNRKLSHQTSPNYDLEEKEYMVEKIISRRRNKDGKTEYLLKWVGYDDIDNSWVDQAALDCKELLDEYERTQAEVKLIKICRKNGFQWRQPEYVVGATDDEDDALWLMMKWKNTDEADLVPAKLVNIVCPQIVIAFYEKCLFWNDALTVTDDQPATMEEWAKVVSEVGDERSRQLETNFELISSQQRNDKILYGFERGLKAEKIVGVTQVNGLLMFLIKWEDSDDADLIPAKQANLECPEVVIKFYEARLSWHSLESLEGDQ